MAKANAGSIVQDWTAVASLAIVHSTEIDTSLNYETDLQLQASVTSVTAHDGTRFIVQISSLASGDEDWVDYLPGFIDLVGTGTSAFLTTAAIAGQTNLIDTKDNISPTGIYMFVEDTTIANSEMVLVTNLNVGSVDILDGLTNNHDVTTTEMWIVATSRNIKIQGTNILRARIVVDNNFDVTGSAIAFKLAKTISTSLA